MGLNLPPPDYLRAVSERVPRGYHCHLKITRRLEILEQVHGLGITLGLLSWVPNWSRWEHRRPPAKRLAPSGLTPEFPFLHQDNPEHFTTILYLWSIRVLRDSISFGAPNTNPVEHKDEIRALYACLYSRLSSQTDLSQKEHGAFGFQYSL
jgi:hypothetical protein